MCRKNTYQCMVSNACNAEETTKNATPKRRGNQWVTPLTHALVLQFCTHPRGGKKMSSAVVKACNQSEAVGYIDVIFNY